MKVLLVALSLCLMACGKKKSSNSSFMSIYPKDGDVSEVKIGCQAEFCPEFIGLLIRDLGESIGHCSGMLINDEYFLTNSHCIEEYNIGDSCSSVSAYFKDYAGTIHRGECEEIVLVNELGDVVRDNTDDYAIFKFKHKPGISSFNANNLEELENASEAYVLATNVLNYKEGVISSEIVQYDCLYYFDTFLSQDAKSHAYPIMSLLSCPVIGGNSGSPVFGPKGGLAGVIYAGHQDNDKEDSSLPNYAIGVSAWCFDEDQYGLFSDDQCVGKNHDYQQSREKKIEELIKEIEQEFKSEMTRVYNRVDKYIVYDKEGNPECLTVEDNTEDLEYEYQYKIYAHHIVYDGYERIRLSRNRREYLSGKRKVSFIKRYASNKYSVFIIDKYDDSSSIDLQSMAMKNDYQYELEACY